MTIDLDAILARADQSALLNEVATDRTNDALAKLGPKIWALIIDEMLTTEEDPMHTMTTMQGSIAAVLMLASTLVDKPNQPTLQVLINQNWDRMCKMTPTVAAAIRGELEQGRRELKEYGKE